MRHEDTLLRELYLEIKQLQAELEICYQNQTEPIAIIGMSCRLPGASNLQAFWELLQNKVDAITTIPSHRQTLQPLAETKQYHWGGFLPTVDEFDPRFFDISPREAALMDPQQRLLLEVSWEALENAGQMPTDLHKKQTGVFIGISSNDYSRLQTFDGNQSDSAYIGTGNALSIAANRLSFVLDLHGPSMSIDTACSSSLVAVHLACQSLRMEECDVALSGGVNLILHPDLTRTFSQAGMLSPDGRCKTFDAAANGYVRGEGCGVIILKRLRDAVHDNDRILALIRGSAVNQDGRTNGLTAPNGFSQQAVIRQAMRNANIRPQDINYVEAHGTGTALGDPIEINALKEVLKNGRAADQTCWIGSVKTNIGHLEAAAGIAGLLKIVLSLINQEIPPNLHLQQLNPYLELANTPFDIPEQRQPWPNDRRRLAGISSFGMGGTNAHMILEEAPIREVNNHQIERPLSLLCLSTKQKQTLRKLAENYSLFLTEHPDVNLTDICFTANTGRAHFPHRLIVTAESSQQLQKRLHDFVQTGKVPGLVTGQAHHQDQQVVFLFTGAGAQYVGMGRQLYKTEPVFREAMDRCNQFLNQYLDRPLLSVLYPETEESTLLDEVIYMQLALFSIEYALAQLWLSWGIEPAAVLGHSIGEYVAACIAGALSLQDGLMLVFRRAQLSEKVAKAGIMAVILADENQVQEAIAACSKKVSIATINGPTNIVVSGVKEDVETILAQFEADGIVTQLLNVSYAAHSPLLDSVLDEFEQIAGQVQYNPLQLPLVSNLTGQILPKKTILDANYWRRHMREPVRFADSIKTLVAATYRLFLELGPKPFLIETGQQCVSEETAVWLPSLKEGLSEWQIFLKGLGKLPAHERKINDWQVLLQSLGTLYVHGVNVNWEAFDQSYQRNRIQLPTYPFERKRYWIQAKTTNGVSNAALAIPVAEPLQSLPSSTTHPLLGDLLSEPTSQSANYIWQTKLNDAKFAYFEDHCISETAVLPASAYVEMATAATTAVLGQTPAHITDLALYSPFFFHPPAASHFLQLTLSLLEDGSAIVQVYGGTAPTATSQFDWTLHASVEVAVAKTTFPTQMAQPDAIKARLPQQLSDTQFYQQLSEYGVQFGESFRGVQQLWYGPQEALGEIALPQNLVQDAAEYHYHPALLDACFQVMAAPLLANATISENRTLYMPVGLQHLQVNGRVSHKVWSYTRLHPDTQDNDHSYSGDVSIFDESGQQLMAVTGLRLQRVDALNPPARTDLPLDWLYKLQWQPVASAKVDLQPAPLPGRWILFADQSGIADNLARQLAQLNISSIFVYPDATSVQAKQNAYWVPPNQPAAMRRFVQDIVNNRATPCTGIVHLWSLNSTGSSNTNVATLTDDLALTVDSALHISQTLAQIDSPPPVWFATQGALAIGDDSVPIAVAQAPLWGWARTLPLEHPEFFGGLIDLDPTVSATASAADLLQLIWQSDTEDQIVMRHGQQYVLRLMSNAVDKNVEDAYQWRSDATYLITGGLGSLGFRLATHMVRQGVKQLILTGRRAPTADLQARIHEMEANGVRVWAAQVDVSNQEEMAHLFADIQTNWPPLRGVCHLAGVTAYETIAEMTTESLRSVLFPKIQGTWILYQLTKDIELDFSLNISSLAAVWGTKGLAHYGAANFFQDVFGHYGRQQGYPVSTINLGPLAGGGMASASDRVRNEMQQTGLGLLPPDKVLTALDHLLSQPMIRQIVADVDWATFKALYNASRRHPLLDHIKVNTVANQQTSIQPTELYTALSAMPTDERLEVLIRHLQEIVVVVMKLAEDDPPNTWRGFFDMGMNSLMVLELRSRLQLILGCTLSATLFFEHATIQALATHLNHTLFSATEEESVEAEESANQTNPAISEIQQLSEDELEALVASELKALIK